METIKIEIQRDEDKKIVAGILFANGYTVKKGKLDGKKKYVLIAWKDEEVETK